MSKKLSAPKVGYRTITPAEAADMLAKSKRANRRGSPGKIRQFAADMLAGHWDPNVSTAISRDWNGDLVNGTNRLTACVQAGVPFTTLFIDGVPPETFANEDTGTARSANDFLTVSGEAHGRALAPTLRALTMWDRGLWHMALSTTRLAPTSNDDLAATLERIPLARKAAAYIAARPHKVSARLRIGLVGALWTLTHGHPKHNDFWAELVDGTNVPPDGVIKKLRDRLDKTELYGTRLKKGMLVALVTKCWNYYAAGEGPEKLSYAFGRGETFPQPTSRLKPLKRPASEGPVPEAKGQDEE